jgi:Holliday junction resolvase RusA-like endonuclease
MRPATGAGFSSFGSTGLPIKSIAPREHIDCSDVPFLPPPDIEVHLPMPPSVNRIWRANKAGSGINRVSISPEYRAWRKAADNLAIAMGKFEAIIILQRTRGDLDNRVKGLLDWAQSRQLVADDKHCERLTVEWGEAPYGCRLILRGVA